MFNYDFEPSQYVRILITSIDSPPRNEHPADELPYIKITAVRPLTELSAPSWSMIGVRSGIHQPPPSFALSKKNVCLFPPHSEFPRLLSGAP